MRAGVGLRGLTEVPARTHTHTHVRPSVPVNTRLVCMQALWQAGRHASLHVCVCVCVCVCVYVCYTLTAMRPWLAALGCGDGGSVGGWGLAPGSEGPRTCENARDTRVEMHNAHTLRELDTWASHSISHMRRGAPVKRQHHIRFQIRQSQCTA